MYVFHPDQGKITLGFIYIVTVHGIHFGAGMIAAWFRPRFLRQRPHAVSFTKGLPAAALIKVKENRRGPSARLLRMNGRSLYPVAEELVVAVPKGHLEQPAPS